MTTKHKIPIKHDKRDPDALHEVVRQMGSCKYTVEQYKTLGDAEKHIQEVIAAQIDKVCRDIKRLALSAESDIKEYERR